jgi:uncharacterized protein (TIGR00290 family)
MFMRVALSSGGKDSLYGIMRVGNIDLVVMFVYEFPRPSPHILNLSKSIETHLMIEKPVVVKALKRGFERIETVEFLKKLGVTEIVAGDVYIEDHLKYMEGVARDVGATLIEPLWGEDPEELLYKEIAIGLEVLVIGTISKLEKWLGIEINKTNVIRFAESCKSIGVDPLGERGEYHTLVVNSPLHKERIVYRKVAVENYSDYYILRII